MSDSESNDRDYEFAILDSALTTMLLYRFDNAERYPVLESKTTARGPVTIRVDPPSADGDQATLRITAPRQPSDLVEPTLVLALPLRAIDADRSRPGNGLGQFLLEVYGDASGSRIWLEADDAAGGGLAYAFGTVGFTGWRTLTADLARPSKRWGSQEHPGACGAALPLQLYRLGLIVGASREGMDIRLKTLRASGDLRFAPFGIADESE